MAKGGRMLGCNHKFSLLAPAHFDWSKVLEARCGAIQLKCQDATLTLPYH